MNESEKVNVKRIKLTDIQIENINGLLKEQGRLNEQLLKSQEYLGRIIAVICDFHGVTPEEAPTFEGHDMIVKIPK